MSPSSVISPPASQRGALRPRLEVRPSGIIGTHGPEAVALARLAGLSPDPWQCDAIDLALSFRADGKWACFEYAEFVARQNGKGAIFEIRALAGLFLLGEQQLMWSAHLYSTAKKAFLRMNILIRNLVLAEVIEPGVIKPIYTNGEQGFLRTDTGQMLEFLARTTGGGRGWTGDVLLLDEVFGYTAEQQDAQMPTVSARPNPQILLTSTPPLDGEASEPMYQLRERAESGEAIALGYRDWGPGGDLETLEKKPESERLAYISDPAVWAATNPALGQRITEETIRRELGAMGSKGFARERLGIWPRRVTGGGAIDTAIWAGLMDPESKRAGDVSIAVDISPQRDYAAIAVYGQRADGLGHMQLVDYRPGTEWIVGQLIELKGALDPLAIGMGRGTHASLEADLTKAGFAQPDDPEKPERGQLAVTSHTDMAAACGQMLDAVRQRSFHHIGQPPLEAAVSGARTRQVGDVLAWARKDAEADTSPLVAVTLARWSYLVREPLLQTTYDALNNFW